MSIQVTHEAGLIPLLCDSTMSNGLNFCFYVFYCNLKEKDHIRRIINSIRNKYSNEKSVLLQF